jgi:hypothetical protein
MNTFTLDIDVTYETADGLEFQQRLYCEIKKNENFFTKRTETMERFEKLRNVTINEYEVSNQSDYNEWLRC